MYNILTPGPTKVAENVRMARALETTNPDLDPAFYEFYRVTCAKYSHFLNTANPSFILSGEGILGLEAACASLTEPGDRVLVLPATVPVDNAVMVFQSEGEYYIRKIKLQDGNRALMQWYDYEPRSEVKSLKELTLVGRARRVEFDL